MQRFPWFWGVFYGFSMVLECFLYYFQEFLGLSPAFALFQLICYLIKTWTLEETERLGVTICEAFFSCLGCSFPIVSDFVRGKPIGDYVTGGFLESIDPSLHR